MADSEYDWLRALTSLHGGMGDKCVSCDEHYVGLKAFIATLLACAETAERTLAEREGELEAERAVSAALAVTCEELDGIVSDASAKYCGVALGRINAMSYLAAARTEAGGQHE